MNIKSFFDRLVPDMERYEVITAIEDTTEQLENTVIDILHRTQPLMRNYKPTSKEFVQVQTRFGLTFPRLKSQPYFVSLETVFKTILENLQHLEEQAAALFSNRVTKESLTYRKIAVLQLIDLSSFAADYVLRQIEFLLAAEAGEIDKRFIAPQLTFIQQNEDAFLRTLNLLYVPNREFVSLLSTVPDITFEPSKQAVVESTVGIRKIDPFKLGFINQKYNVFYHVGRRNAERQNKKQQLRKSQKQILELRLLAMQQAAHGSVDARAQQQMDYLTGRIQTLDHEIEVFDQRHA